MYTSYGLVASERNDPSQGVLWFAHAARLAGAGTEQEPANRIRVATWGRQALQPVRALLHADEWLHTLVFHREGRYLLTQTLRPGRGGAADDFANPGECTLWDLVQESPLAWPAGLRTVSSATWSSDGRQLALGTSEGAIFLCTFPAGAVVRQIPFGGSIRLLAFSPDGHYLAAASANTVRVWDCQAGAYATPKLEHPGLVTTLAFHPRGHRLATGCLDHQARVFAVPTTTGETLFPPVPHYQLFERITGCVPVAPTFLDEGRGLLTVPSQPQGADRRVIWRDAENGAVVRFVAVPEADGIFTVTVSPDDRHFAVGGFHGAQIWEVAGGGRAVGPFLRGGRWQGAIAAAFSPDGRTLVVGATDHTLRRWSVPDGQALGGPIAHPTGVQRVAFSADGRFLASAQRGGLVRIWAAPTDHPRDYPLPLDGSVSKSRFSLDGRYVLPTGDTSRNCSLRSTRVYELATGQPAGPSLAAGGILLDAAFSPDGRQVAALVSLAGSYRDRQNRPESTSAQPGFVKLWDWRTGALTCAPLTLPSEPRSLDYSPDGKCLAVLCAGGQLLLVNPFVGQILTQWQAHAAYASNNNYINNGLLRFSPDGQSLVTLGKDAFVRVWEASTAQLRYAPLGHTDRCFDAQFSADGQLLTTASWDKTVRIWDARTGQALASPLPHPDRVYSAVFTRDGTRVLTGCDDCMARLWDWQTGQPVCPAFKHEEFIRAVACHPNGRWILNVSLDGVLRVWDGRTGKPVTPPLATGGGEGISVAVTPDGNYAVVGDWTADSSMSALQVVYLGDLSDAATMDLEDLCTWGEVLSGRRVHEGNGVTNLTTEEWLARWRNFRQRHPDYGRLEPAAALAQDWRAARVLSLSNFSAWEFKRLSGASKVVRHWPAAMQHLDRLIAAYPEVGPLHAGRGHVYAELEQWHQAARAYARASQLRPEDTEIGQRRALLCLAMGDDMDYQRVCADLLQRFGGSSGLRDAVNAVWVCTLRPDAVPEPSQLVRIAKQAVAEIPGRYFREGRTILGAVLYRAGRFEEAIDQLNEAMVAQQGEGVFQDWLFLAMAHQRLGHVAEARPWLERTIQWAEQKQSDAQPLSWWQRLELQILRDEAEGLIQGNRF